MHIFIFLKNLAACHKNHAQRRFCASFTLAAASRSGRMRAKFATTAINRQPLKAQLVRSKLKTAIPISTTTNAGGPYAPPGTGIWFVLGSPKQRSHSKSLEQR